MHLAVAAFWSFRNLSLSLWTWTLGTFSNLDFLGFSGPFGYLWLQLGSIRPLLGLDGPAHAATLLSPEDVQSRGLDPKQNRLKTRLNLRVQIGCILFQK